MTNEQIIYEIAVQIYGDAAVQRMIEEDGEIPLHTVQGWAQRGPYKIKKGEHGIETRLWRRKKKAKSAEPEKMNEQDGENANENREFYLCKAFLFRADQVELRTEK